MLLYVCTTEACRQDWRGLHTTSRQDTVERQWSTSPCHQQQRRQDRGWAVAGLIPASTAAPNRQSRGWAENGLWKWSGRPLPPPGPRLVWKWAAHPAPPPGVTCPPATPSLSCVSFSAQLRTNLLQMSRQIGLPRDKTSLIRSGPVVYINGGPAGAIDTARVHTELVPAGSTPGPWGDRAGEHRGPPGAEMGLEFIKGEEPSSEGRHQEKPEGEYGSQSRSQFCTKGPL